MCEHSQQLLLLRQCDPIYPYVQVQYSKRWWYLLTLSIDASAQAAVSTVTVGSYPYMC